VGVINIIDKLWKYLSGYAIISIEGFNKMKLINKAVKKFIKFSDITSNRVKATAIIPIEDLKKLYELMEIKYQDLLHALNTGKIDQKQFLESYSKLRELQRNSISELITSDETLRRHTR